MSEPVRLRTYRQNRLWLRKKMSELDQMTTELRTFEASLPFPSLAELEEMVSGRRPWTREVYLAAITNRMAFYVEEAWTEAAGYFDMASPVAERRGLPLYLVESLRFAVKFRESLAARREEGA